MKKRLFTLALALILCLGLFPLTALAGTEEPTKENPAPLSSATINIPSSFGDTWIYQGSAVEPNVYVSVNGTYMFEGDDFSVSYENNNGPGTGTIIISALPGGRLTGSITKFFTIEQLDGDLSSSKTGVYLFGGNSDGTFPWTGSQIKPDVMVELNDMWTLTGSEYSVEYGPNTDPGKAWVKITGNGTSTGGVPVTGTRTVYFKIVDPNGGTSCAHTATYLISDGAQGHHTVCGICSESLSEVQPHTMGERQRVDGDNGVVTFLTVCTAGCGYFEEDGPYKDMDQSSVTGADSSKAYKRNELDQVGLSGLTAGVDYTKTIQDGGEKWVVIMEPVAGKSVGGKRTVELTKYACPHTNTTPYYDGTNHWYECDECHEHLDEEPHIRRSNYDNTHHWWECTVCDWESDREAHTKKTEYSDMWHWEICSGCDWSSDDQAHSFTTAYDDTYHWGHCDCGYDSEKESHAAFYRHNETQHWGECQCGWQSEPENHVMVDQPAVNGMIVSECECGYSTTRPVPDLSQVETTGDPNQSYTQQGIAAVGLKGLQEGKDYTTQTVAEKDEDGNDIWTKTFKPIEGRSIGEQVFRGKRATAVEYKLTIHYVAEDTQNQSKMPKDISTYWPSGKYYRYRSPDVQGLYPNIQVVEGTMPAGDVAVTVTYSETQTAMATETYKLSIFYVAENPQDNVLMPHNFNTKVAKGSKYSRKSPTLSGLIADRDVVEGTMPGHNVDVIVTYRRDSETTVSDHYRLTVNYEAADPKNNDQMPPSHTEFHKENETYVVWSPAVKDLTPTEKVVQGTMPRADLDITVTYAKKYTLTIKMVMPGGDPEAQFQDGGIWMEKFELDDGTAYSYAIEDLFTTEALMSDVNLEDTLTGEGLKGSWFTADILGIAMITGQLQESGAIFTPDRDPVEGKIEGADKMEIVKFSCPHPDQYLVYSSNEDDTHDFKCDLCGEILLENEACDYDVKEYTVGDLPKDLQAKYPNGATYHQCPLCKHEYWVNPDDEACPASPEGLPHIWTLWYKADAEHCHRTCARCGLDVTEPHDWSSWTSMGGLHHYRKCSHCREIEEGDHGSWKNVTVTSPATCIENAKVDATCGVCNARITNVSASLLGKEYLATGHDFENGPWHIDGPHTVSAEGAGGHYKSCAVCGVTDREHMTGHTWGGKTVISAGVCDDPSQKHVEEATCTACGAKLHSETEVHHDQVRYPEGDIAATCEDYGKEAYKCSVCNTVFGDAIPPLGHDMQVVEKKDADCEHEGYIKRKCSRCNLEETEVLEKKSKSGKHQWVPNVSIPDCLLPGEAKGETCSVCGATQAGNTGFETFPALGHKVKKETRTVGRTREYVSDNGVTTCTCYEVYYICERCGHALGHEYYTVGTNPNISRYQIEPGKNVRIDDVSGGIHIDGNMANDGGVYFNEEVKKGVNDLLDWAGEKYVWKKTPANSYIIEFTEEFMNELEDGEYPLEVTNGDEYWPMIVVVKDHKFVDIKTMPEDDTEHFLFTSEQFDAWKRDVTADGTPLKEYMLGCPAR